MYITEESVIFVRDIRHDYNTFILSRRAFRWFYSSFIIIIPFETSGNGKYII